MTDTTVHIPILVAPIVEALLEPFKHLPADAPTHWILDCTLGGGGHTSHLLRALNENPHLQQHKVLALDQDPTAIARAQARFATEIEAGRLELLQGKFGAALDAIGERPVLGILADLGFSSDQMDDPARGLSFMKDGPLDMRLDPTQGRNARDILAQTSEYELAKLLSEYGEERFSNRIARAIVDARRHGKLPRTTAELSEIIVNAVPPPARHGRIHAATRTFQALRIFVNEELYQLDCLLERVILKLQAGGRVAILSFHSLEDRKVKHAFRGGEFNSLTKKPIEPDEAEIRANPRSRSAKLRIAERCSPITARNVHE